MYKLKLWSLNILLVGLLGLCVGCVWTIHVDGYAKEMLQNPEHESFIMRVSDTLAEVVAVCYDDWFEDRVYRGTGTFVSHDGLMITALHIVNKGICDINVFPWRVSPSSGKITEPVRVPMEIVHRYKDKDLVILMPKKRYYATDVLPIPVGLESQVDGEKLWLFGLSSYWSQGNVEKARHYEAGRTLMVASGNVIAGDSGGPAVDEKGVFAGVIIAYPENSRDRTIVVPITTILTDLYLHITGRRKFTLPQKSTWARK